MKTTLLIAIGLAALWGSGAQAAQITFGPSNQSITFTGNGANSVAVSSPTLTGSAFDTTNGSVGSFTLSALSFNAGPQIAGTFSVVRYSGWAGLADVGARLRKKNPDLFLTT